MTDVVVGDTDLPRLEVSPADGSTTVTLTLRAPDGTSTPIPVTPGDVGTDGAAYTAGPVTYTAPGRWVLDWQVTGTGQGVEPQTVYVLPSPTAGGPTWWPGRQRVANYIPQRTLTVPSASIGESGDTYELVFGPTTRPTGRQVDRLIADQAAFVAARIPELAVQHHEAAGTVVAMLVAAAVERGFFDSDSLQRATDLERRGLSMLDGLAAANDEATGESGDGSVMPVWSFPSPAPWGDQLI